MLESGEIVRRYRGPTVGVHHVRVAGDDHGMHAHDDVQLFVAFAGCSMKATWCGSSGSRRRFGFDDDEIHVVGPNQEHRFDWAFIDMVSAFASAQTISDLLDGAFRMAPSFDDIRGLRDPVVSQYAMRLAREVRASPLDPLAVEAGVFAMIVRIGERLAGRGVREVRLSSTAWQRLIDYIEAHLGEALSIARLAKAADVPAASLGRAFRNRFGIAPHRFILERRLARAKTMLLDGASIGRVAADLGFSQQSHFTQAFRRENGITPAHYRRLIVPAPDF